VRPEPDRYERSRALYERACRVLAGGVSSEFRRHQRPVPLFYRSARGATILDEDGNHSLDFTLSQGPAILGHAHPGVNRAVADYARRGVCFAGQHLRELELAETLQRLIPCAELVRFSLSGSEANHMALRTARAFTGRARFIRFEGHYHGWFDNVAFGNGGAAERIGPREAPTPVASTAGLPSRVFDEAIVLPWNDLSLVEDTLRGQGGEIAAVITEPIMCNHGCIPPRPGFLEGLRALCDRHGCALIFDEVITGFRLGLGGAQARMGVTPDLAVFGKAMANGYPISALVGRRRWMDRVARGEAVHAGTLNGSNPCVAAAVATIAALERGAVPGRLERLGLELMRRLRVAAGRTGERVLLQGPGAMFHLGFTTAERVDDYRGTLAYDRERLAAFVLAMQDRGIRLIGRGLWYLSAAHTERDVARAAATAEDAMRTLSART
jgi:glutamate-1-semialdehyde 2,1-aminomutase